MPPSPQVAEMGFEPMELEATVSAFEISFPMCCAAV
jgi:hypothetical protein